MPETAPLKIAFVASEVAPFAKTGGLADVASALPRYLHSQDHDVRVFMPLHGRIDLDAYAFTRVDFLRDVLLTIGAHQVTISVYVARAPGSDLDIYFIHCPALYHRPSIYTGEADESVRFATLCHAAFACCQRMGWAPDILHANDWHSALVPLLKCATYRWDRLFRQAKTVLTIHNIAYQGMFPAATVDEIGLGAHRDLLHQDDLRAGAVSFLKTGLLHADVITTVSETYAKEIQTPAFGMGLEDLLRARSASVIGIVNGVDYGTWNPEVDPHIEPNYGIDGVEAGKRANKDTLLATLDLAPTDRAPLFGIVSRLTGQKGFELLFEPLPAMLHHLDVRLVVLGTGERQYERFFHELQQQFPDKVCFHRGYHEPLAHRIEAAADIFLMPSKFEPCGLNQMYSLKYGTVPIVRKTGGLADTVHLFDPKTREGTGFVFDHYTAEGMTWALERALATYQDQEAWAQLRANGMQRDYSWERQGAQYEKLYRRLIG